MTDKTSVNVMTLVGDAQPCKDPLWSEIDALPAPPGFCWRFVPDGAFAVQFRSILRMDARAVVVWIGANDAIDRAAKLISRLLGAGLPIVIAIAEVHDPRNESVLRQAGALYICANEAEQRLGQVLESILIGPAPPSTGVETIESTRKIKMDAG
ncbi:MAG TPA: hypothetical protein VHX86_05460 [Tepidisphaeraceae bacterium]|nr:hypothetical protein [Tepidisphaeraceae bacterium]